ncbi:MAG: nucleotidyltransferase domain-containing protein [Bacteroidetes bacterium]|nr:nucleotidyltransferase domain-containing protein [Fibrella sp.]
MYGLTPELLMAIQSVLADNTTVDEAVLFGSRAKGNFRPGSDIDIALKGQGLKLNDLLELGLALDDLETPYRFDLVIYHRITEPVLHDHIDRMGRVLYQKTVSSVSQ